MYTRSLPARLLIAAALGITIPAAHAALQDLGNGIVLDPRSGIEWLANANLAATDTFGVSGIDANGNMSWNTAVSWIAAMNAAHYLGYSDWRLPTTDPVNGSTFQVTFSYVGTTDRGYNIGAPGTLYSGSNASEMSNLYYNGLGNPELCGSTGCRTTNLPPLSTGPFRNVQSTYWSGTQDQSYLGEPFSFIFQSDAIPYGEQQLSSASASFGAWAVRAVPEPGVAALMMAGLGLLGCAAGRGRRA